jgi:hypothetical protein
MDASRGFEKDSRGNEVLLQAILEGYEPDPGELKPNKTAYARALFFTQAWPRDRIMNVLDLTPGQLALMLRPEWLGLAEPSPQVEPDWKAAYEAATVREQNLRNENLILSARIRRAQEYATELRSSHPSRLEHAKAVGDMLWRRLS